MLGHRGLDNDEDLGLALAQAGRRWALGALYCHSAMVTDIYRKFKHLFENNLLFVSGGVFTCPIRTRVRIPSPRFSPKVLAE